MKYKKLKLIILILLYILLFNNDSIGTYVLDRITAIIDEDIILESNITNIKKFNKQYGNNYFYKTQNNTNFSRKEILNQLITDTLILQLAQHANIDIDENQIHEIINYIATQNYMTKTQFLSYLNNIGINYSDYVNHIRKNIIINTICDYEIHQRINISPDELQTLTKQLIKKNNNTKFRIDHILIPLQENENNHKIEQANTLGIFLAKEIEHGITIEQLKKLYSKNKKLQTLKINKIDWSTLEELPTLFSKNLIKQDKIHINNVFGPIRSNVGFHILKIKDIIHNGIEKDTIIKIHIRHILIKKSNINNDINIQTQLTKIKERIQKKKSTFSIEAQQISEDPHSSNKGGDLGWKNLDDTNKTFQKLIKSLKKGDISEPIKTHHGWHLIQLIDTKKINKNENSSKEEAYKILFNKKIDETMKDWIQELKTLTYIKILNNHE